MTQKEIEKVFEDHKGYLQLSDIRKMKIHYSYIKQMLGTNIIEKVKAGLYRLVAYDHDSNMQFIELCRIIPYGVICLTSALSYYEVTSTNPQVINIAIPHAKKKKIIHYPPVKYHYYRGRSYEMGIDTIKTTHGSFRIYSIEKTICDCIRNRYIPSSLAIEAMKDYSKRKNKDIPKIIAYARDMGVEKKISDYLQIILS